MDDLDTLELNAAVASRLHPESPMQEHVIVTGSSGLIGHALCETLARDGFSVLGFDRPGMPHPPASTENIPCDLTSDASVAEAVSRARRMSAGAIASVIHLAAYYDFSGEPSPLYEDVTVCGTHRLLRALRDLRVGQFAFSSTMLVHAPCEPGQRIDEDWPLEPKWDYPASKLRTEELIGRERAGIPAVLLRIAGVYTNRGESIPLAHQIQRIYERRLTASVFPGDTARGQSFVHLSDLIDAFRAVIANRRTLPDEIPLLIGEEDPLSYDTLQRTLAGLIHGEREWTTTQIPKAVAKAGAWVQDRIPGVEEPFIKPWMIDLADDHYALDASRARDLLSWMPQRSLEETLPEIVAALQADPERWYADNKLEGSPSPAPRGARP